MTFDKKCAILVLNLNLFIEKLFLQVDMRNKTPHFLKFGSAADDFSGGALDLTVKAV